MRLERLTSVLRVISHPPRLKLLVPLSKLNRGLCVCELVDSLDLPQYQVSRQLGELRDEDLVKRERDGTWAYYSFNPNLPDSVKVMIQTIVGSLDKEEFEEEVKKR